MPRYKINNSRAKYAAEDFIGLAFYRIDSLDTYSDPLWVTSTEFRYAEA